MARALYLIRHGVPDVARGICYGRSDVPLREAAPQTAERLRSHLPPRFALVSSPLQRCRLLADSLGRPQYDMRLAEVDFGRWEGCHFDDIPRTDIDTWAAAPLDFRPPNGETVREMLARVLAALTEILSNTTGDVVLVTHGGPLRGIVAQLAGEIADAAGAVPGPWLARVFDYGSLSTAHLAAGGVVTLHLDQGAASAGRTR
jgi:alpha-ribazole phosphatase